MKVAIATDNGKVSAHFGHCAKYTIAQIQNAEVTDKQEISNPGHSPGFLPKYLAEHQVDCVISGGMGNKAQQMFAEREIDTIVGVDGKVDDVLTAFGEGRLQSTGDYCQH